MLLAKNINFFLVSPTPSLKSIPSLTRSYCSCAHNLVKFSIILQSPSFDRMRQFFIFLIFFSSPFAAYSSSQSTHKSSVCIVLESWGNVDGDLLEFLRFHPPTNRSSSFHSSLLFFHSFRFRLQSCSSRVWSATKHISSQHNWLFDISRISIKSSHAAGCIISFDHQFPAAFHLPRRESCHLHENFL